VVKHLPMQWMAIWMHPYGHQSHGGGLKWLNQGNRITLPSYIYKVIKNILMQLLVVWMHPYFI